MKRFVYIVLLMLTCVNSFAISSNCLGIHESRPYNTPFDSYLDTLNDAIEMPIINSFSVKEFFCNTPLEQCSSFVSLLNTEDRKCKYCLKLFSDLWKEMKIYAPDKTHNGFDSTCSTTNYLISNEVENIVIPPRIEIFKSFQHINVEEYFQRPINQSDSQGFGIRINL